MTEKVKRITIMRGHTSTDTAYVVDDYPYGFRLRCSIRYWVETAEKGAKKGRQRFMSQTTNPKKPGDPWNKPKGSTYSLMVWMYLDDNEHVQWTGVSEHGATPVSDARLRLRGIYEQMTHDERTLYDALVKVSKRYAEPWEDWDRVVNALADHIQQTGKEPELENGVWVWPGGRAYIGHDMPVYVTSARNRVADR